MPSEPGSVAKPIVGLTGGIGTGKSTVAALFARHGAIVVDADAIVHELQAPGAPMLAAIAELFGAVFRRAEGSLDRAMLGAHVFGEAEARAALGRITHGPVGAELLRRIDAARRSEAPLVVVDVPLLFEGAKRRAGDGPPQTQGIDGVVVVYAPEAVQIQRQQARDGVGATLATQRVRAQMPIDEKRELADWVIDNGGSLEETEAQVAALFAQLTGTTPSASAAAR